MSTYPVQKILRSLGALILLAVLELISAGTALGSNAAVLISQKNGPPGTEVLVSGTGFVSLEKGIFVMYDGVRASPTMIADVNGTWGVYFTIPLSVSGKHTIRTYSPLSGSFNQVFEVIPGIVLSSNKGSSGTAITANGTGFVSMEPNIVLNFAGYDITSVRADAYGSWRAVFPIPETVPGTFGLHAYGSKTPATPDIPVYVTPGISLSSATGAPGDIISVCGSTFRAGESGITVTYDSSPVAKGIQASDMGSWSCNITIPASGAGPHTLHASGTFTAVDVQFTVATGVALSRTTGTPGMTLKVHGSGFAAGETGIALKYDGAGLVSGIQANATGAWEDTFVVPPSPRGPHTITATGSSTTRDTTFNITPCVVVDQADGAPGTTVMATGSGFGVAEKDIKLTFDSLAVVSGLRSDDNGGWVATFKIPPFALGPHTIRASGSVPASASSDAIFTVKPAMVTDRTSGTPGTTVSVNGHGFGVHQDIALTFDGVTVATGLRADNTGTWTAIFPIPDAPGGTHHIRSEGTTSGAAPEVTFKVMPGIWTSRENGAPDTLITISGYGFAAGETNITATYDAAEVASGITADSRGKWTAEFAVPVSACGEHTIGVRSELNSAGVIGGAKFKSTPGIIPEQSEVYSGSVIQITGSGFAAVARLKCAFDDKDIPATGATSDGSGSFKLTVTFPKAKAGAHTITVTDAQKNSASAALVMDSTPPPAPAPESPDSGVRLGLFGGASPTLAWTGVSDPSGVTYDVQVDVKEDFSRPVLNRNITGNRYTLSDQESLPYGGYYWRVRAVDGASNQGPWSDARLIRSGVLPLTVLLGIVLAVVAAVAVFVVMRRRQARSVSALRSLSPLSRGRGLR